MATDRRGRDPAAILRAACGSACSAGSFNPPHAGHALVCELALKRLGLDRVWLMVSPGNPLKSREGLPSLSERMAAARRLIRDPRVVVTGFEAEIGAVYSFQTVDFLRRACPGVHFVWIMGADNLASFFRWRRWREIARKLPIAVVDRPGATHRAERGARRKLVRPPPPAGISGENLCPAPPPALIVLHGQRSSLSSTRLRAARSGSINQSP